MFKSAQLLLSTYPSSTSEYCTYKNTTFSPTMSFLKQDPFQLLKTEAGRSSYFCRQQEGCRKKGSGVPASLYFQNKKIQGMVQWKKLNTSIYFFALSVSPHLNFFFTLPYSLKYFVFFPAFEVNRDSPFPS